MGDVAKISPHLHIPAPDTLKAIKGWLVWRYEAPIGNAQGKPRKVPYYVGGGRRYGQQGTAEEMAKLATYDAAMMAAKRGGFDGIGFATLEPFGITSLDFDNCVHAGQVDDRVLALVADTYAELSPSGKGVRAFYRGQLGNDKAHGEPFGFEVFSTKGFVTFTGDILPGLDLLGLDNVVAELPQRVRDYAARRFDLGLGDRARDLEVAPLGMTDAQLKQCLAVLDPNMGYTEWLQVGMAIHHETHGGGFDLWDDWSAGARGDTYPGHELLQSKWDSFSVVSFGAPVTARTLLKKANQAGAGVNLNLATVEDFEDLTVEEAPRAALPQATAEKPGKFHVYQASDFSKGQRTGWHIKRLLPAAPLVLVYGESGSGKSFLVLDMILSCVRGQAWRDHKATPGAWIYVAAEGAGGVRRRLEAYALHHDIDLADIDLGIVGSAPNILAGGDITELVAEINAWQRLRRVRIAGIAVDTMAQVTPGANENSGEDMGLALSNLEALRRGTGALTVVPVHHAGKDTSKGARGWSGIRAAADAELEVRRTSGGRAVKVTKQKDGEDGAEYGFNLAPISVGWDEDDEAITSCVVEAAELPAIVDTRAQAPALHRGANEKIIMAVVEEFALGQSEGIEVAAVLDEALRREKYEGAAYIRRGLLKRSLKQLCKGEHAIYRMDDDEKTFSLVD